jgi:hypothetical protein
MEGIYLNEAMHLTLWLVSDCKYCIMSLPKRDLGVRDWQTCGRTGEVREMHDYFSRRTQREKTTWETHKCVRSLYQCELKKKQLTACWLGSSDQKVSPVADAYAHCEDHLGSVRCGDFMATCAIYNFSSTDLLNCVRSTKHFFVICKEFMFDRLWYWSHS